MKIQLGLSLITGFVESLFFCGVYFGFPSLQFVLEKEGYFEYLCKNITSNTTLLTLNNVSNVSEPCGEQEASFNLVYTLGLSSLYTFAFPSGYVFDKFGTWMFRTILTTLYTLGYILLTTSSPYTSNLLYPASIFMGVSGLGLLASNFQIANFSETYRGTILSLLNGLFDSSVVVFLLIKKVHESGTQFHSIFQFMTGISVFLWLRTYLLLPKKHIPFFLPSDNIKFGWKEIECHKKRKEKHEDIKSSFPKLGMKSAETECVECEDNKKQEFVTFKRSLKNSLFWTHAFHFSVLSLRYLFIPSSLLRWLRSFALEDDISTLVDEFGFFTLSGALVSFLAGVFIDAIKKTLKSKTKNDVVRNLGVSAITTFLTSVFCLILSITTLASSVYGSFACFLLVRGFIHPSNTVFLAYNFPFEDFGKLYGLINFMAGLLGLLQYAIFQISLYLDPTFYYINVGFIITTISTLIHPVLMLIKIRSSTVQQTTRL